ncbi:MULTISPECIES: hypothetical protein [Gulbenkiania]|uniref:hypothetical protein n=1 Tax=Gulbenkiania TaxID=397456 RepID=UPI0011475EB8|nr:MULTISPECIES: hypothetical protein [Gulbenkiania]
MTDSFDVLNKPRTTKAGRFQAWPAFVYLLRRSEALFSMSNVCRMRETAIHGLVNFIKRGISWFHRRAQARRKQ